MSLPSLSSLSSTRSPVKTTPRKQKIRPQNKWTPEKDFPLHLSPSSGKLRISYSPNTEKKLPNTSAVYRFKKTQTNELPKRYIGKSCHLDARTHAHLSAASQTLISQALQQSPQKCSFGIIRHSQDPATLNEIEREAIIQQDSIQHGFNQRNDGGGGTTQPKTTLCSGKAFKQAIATLKKSFQMPIQDSFYRSERNFIRVKYENLNPLLEKCIYIITTKDKKHYVGYTSGILKKRMTEHASKANHHTKYPQKLYAKLHSFPSCCKVGVVDTSSISTLSLPDQERTVIQVLKKLGKQILNCNGGGGGSWVG